MPNRAAIVHRQAWLGTEFGESFARRLFSDEVVEASPRNTRGKNKGKFKATVRWRKVERGGWVPHEAGEGQGHVETRVGKVISAELVLIPLGGGSETVLAKYTRDDESFRSAA